MRIKRRLCIIIEFIVNAWDVHSERTGYAFTKDVAAKLRQPNWKAEPWKYCTIMYLIVYRTLNNFTTEIIAHYSHLGIIFFSMFVWLLPFWHRLGHQTSPGISLDVLTIQLFPTKRANKLKQTKNHLNLWYLNHVWNWLGEIIKKKSLKWVRSTFYCISLKS